MLLDTHTLLWFLSNDPKLIANARDRIENAKRVVVSIVTLWEIAIKLSINKLELDFAFENFPSLLQQLEIELLTLSFADVRNYVRVC